MVKMDNVNYLSNKKDNTITYRKEKTTGLTIMHK